jgi:hypothetical protein
VLTSFNLFSASLYGTNHFNKKLCKNCFTMLRFKFKRTSRESPSDSKLSTVALRDDVVQVFSFGYNGAESARSCRLDSKETMRGLLRRKGGDSPASRREGS